MPSQLQAREHVALEPVVGRALAVLLENPRLANGLPIVERALQDDLAKPLHQRRMRIALAVRERVVLPVAGHPLLRHDRRREPQPHPHRDLGELAERHAAMRLRAMQKQRHADVREMTGDDHEEHRLPPVRRPHCESWHCVLT